MNIELFIQRAEALHKQLADLYQTASVLPWIPPDLLPQAFKELYSNSKLVQLAAEELYHQNEELLQTRSLLEAERQHYYNLFEFAPDGYLVTNAEGIIQEVNLTAVKLLNAPKHILLDQSMINFIRLEERESFRGELNQLLQSDKVKELVVRLQQFHGESFDAVLTLAVVRNQNGKINSLRWLLRHINERQQKDLGLVNNENYLSQDRPIYIYPKGENIPLNPLVIWYVRQGLVKLSTFSETGEEVLMGLAKTHMVFGSSMTSLPIYQATALSDVELVSINSSEIAVTPMLSHILLPKINQRLRQTESFLVIAGRRRVEDRLYHLLKLLQQEIGESVSEGIRLSVRFTHEDIANACCTTRVTVTRLMGKLQQQGLISFDSKKHIIIRMLETRS
ncbi:helix-turn-helix domain-containing protein [Anabaena subtropica]|uniref:Helix-turn-helix domain-containing protein n=1 Tax=Anabaena subtropica FACHB-260 TaxID=2692884 RepID=A0ABR8CW04_9NOST|nr:helix-turn-helix domain-containing protein [Anabaena subtropica]MBD2346946.1 helix-turn-helix domain-containing protein [Anabaena subtropica FACHB-260]